MGADIHPYFETRTETGWEPTFGWQPDPEWWWERIADHKVDTGAAAITLVVEEGETEYDATVRYLKTLSMEQVVEQYGRSRYLGRLFNLPGTSYGDRFRDRDYRFFAAIASVRGSGNHKPKGLPEDLSEPVQYEYDSWEADAHSMTWFMVSDLLADPNLKGFRQIDWLREHIKDPENTRLVCWFDN